MVSVESTLPVCFSKMQCDLAIKMNSVGWFVTGLTTGFILSSVVAFRFSWRLVQRLRYVDGLESLAQKLEKRRAAIDSKREDEIRPEAGPPGQEKNLFPVRPGRQVLNRLAERNTEKLPKEVDTDQDSTII